MHHGKLRSHEVVFFDYNRGSNWGWLGLLGLLGLAGMRSRATDRDRDRA
ncbi:WGxxGxxG family protein [Paenibacillus sp. 2TAB26]